MNMNAFLLLMAAMVYFVGFYELRKTHSDVFGVGLFLAVVQFVVAPWVLVFVSWFIKIGADGGVPVATYLQGLFIASILLGIYFISHLFSNYVKK